MDIFSALLAYLHFGAMMLLAAFGTVEFMMLKRNLDAKAVVALSRVDMVYVTCGVVVLLSGAVRLGTAQEGVIYFGGNVLFWLKLLLFSALALTSLFMSWRYSRWAHLARMDLSFYVSPADAASTLLLVKFQLVLLAIVPLLAVLMVRGIAR